MGTGAAEWLDPKALDGAEVADVAGDQGFVVFERRGCDQGVAEPQAIAGRVFFDEGKSLVADGFADRKLTQSQFANEATSDCKFLRGTRTLNSSINVIRDRAGSGSVSKMLLARASPRPSQIRASLSKITDCGRRPG